MEEWELTGQVKEGDSELEVEQEPRAPAEDFFCVGVWYTMIVAIFSGITQVN